MNVRLAVLGGAVLLLSSCRDRSPPPPAVVPAVQPRGPLRWLAAGGGDLPESNPVSIEEDLRLAARVLGPGGELLYAGGPGTKAVQVEARRPAGDALKAALAELIDPRPGRDAHYRESTLAARGPATHDAILTELRRVTAEPTGGDFLLYLAGHGRQGRSPAENGLLTWGGTALTPVELEEVLDTAAPARRLRVVVTSCFSGGFADILFSHADDTGAAAPGDRCGLFASTWEDESSGCDPNPDRAAHEGFGIHFLHALVGEDRNGQALDLKGLDLDGDGVISLLEAQTAARLASRGIDIPTTTSERWLRARAPAQGRSATVELPAEAIVVARFAPRLGGVEAARQELERLSEALQTAREGLEDAEDAEDAEADAYRDVAVVLLSRWPVLNDPWHPDFDRTLARDRRHILAFIDHDPLTRGHARAARAVERARGDVDDLMEEKAPLARLVRAADNLDLAGRLRAKGGADWQVFERLRACENSRP